MGGIEESGVGCSAFAKTGERIINIIKKGFINNH
jgi:hypothetical protein